jgi:hypothetical protein
MSITQLKSTGKVEWTLSKTYNTIDGDEVTHYGLDYYGNYYYKTANAIYIKMTDGWIKVTL